MNIFIVSAHPDDETLGVGGTILKLKQKKNNLFWILLTSPSIEGELKKVEAYVEKAVKFYKFDDFFWLKIPTKKFSYENLSTAIEKMKEIFKRISPEIIFTVSETDIHSDHFFTYKSTIASVKPFTSSIPQSILKYEVLSSSNIYQSKQSSFCPNAFSDITEFINEKEKAFEIFSEEIQELPYSRNKETIRALSRYRGSMAGVMYAEAFEIVFGRF